VPGPRQLPLRVAAAVRRRGRFVASLVAHPRVPQTRPAVRDAPVRLVVGPANFAGQAWEWARAVERELPDVSATVVGVRDRFEFPADYAVEPAVYRSARWSLDQRRWVERSFSHVLLDGVRPLTGPILARDARRDLAAFRQAGLAVGLVAHGSEVRLPSRHRELYPYSPFDPALPETARLQANAERFGGVLARDPGPAFVSTPDLLDFVPRATWLPVVVDARAWRSDAPVLERARPVVVHAPSNPWLKGTAAADAALSRLHEQGLVEYRRVEGVRSADIPALVADADVVLDQLVIGCYGVMAVQAMHAGRLVVAHLPDHVRARFPAPPPVVECGPGDVTQVMTALLDDRDAFRAIAARGPAYAADVHDGRRSAGALAAFLGRAAEVGPGDPAR